jgi:hypothetical protein
MNQITPQRPQFDYLTMQAEWRDYLVSSGYPADTLDHRLIAELVKYHASGFSHKIAKWGVLWIDIEGDFAMPTNLIGEIEPPTSADLDLAWYDAFEEAACCIEEIQQHFSDLG